MIWLLDGVAAVLRRWPARWSPAAQRVLVRALVGLWPARVEVATTNLRMAWPEGPPTTARAVLEHLLGVARDFLHLRTHRANGYRAVAVPQLSRLTDAVSKGRGVVVASGHLGSWELSAAAVAARCEVAAHLVVKPLGPIDGWVNRERRRAGLHTITAGQGARTVRAVVRALKRGEIVVLVVDQHAPSGACIAPLFGRPAATETLPARVAALTGAPLLWLAPARTGRDAHRVSIIEVPNDRSGRPKDVREVTLALNAHLEAAIRAHPPQWLWTHRRWKVSTPAGAQVAGER